MIEDCSVWEFEVKPPSILEAEAKMEDWHAFVIGFQNNTSLLSSSSSESQHQFRVLSVLLTGHVHHRGMDAPPAFCYICFKTSCSVCIGWKLQCNTLHSEMCWMLYCLM